MPTRKRRNRISQAMHDTYTQHWIYKISILFYLLHHFAVASCRLRSYAHVFVVVSCVFFARLMLLFTRISLLRVVFWSHATSIPQTVIIFDLFVSHSTCFFSSYVIHFRATLIFFSYPCAWKNLDCIKEMTSDCHWFQYRIWKELY